MSDLWAERTPFLAIKIHHVSDYIDSQVIASEDWKGVRPDYKVASDEASFRVDYTPKFLKSPIIKERRIMESAGDEKWIDPHAHEMGKRSIFGKKKRTTTTTTTTTTTEPPYYLW